MGAFLQRIATPLTLGLFLVSAISGAALFFHFQQGAFHSMHEWLSMVLLVPIGLHVWRNWTPLVAYVRRNALLVPLAVSVLAAAAFAFPALTRPAGGPPAPMRAAQLLTQAPLKDLAPILKTSPEQLQARLQARGYTVTSQSESLAAIAEAAHVPSSRLLSEVMPVPTSPTKR